MGYLPIFVELGGKPCVVIGGGELAAAKLRILLEAGARVTVISSLVSPEINDAIQCGKVRHVAREYIGGDLEGHCLAFVANDNRVTAERAVAEGQERGILINVVDQRGLSGFISPAVLARGELKIAISTGGSSPALARLLRQQLEHFIRPEYALVLEIMRRARGYLRKHQPDPGRRAETLNSLAAELCNASQSLDNAKIAAALKAHLEAGMAELGIEGVPEPLPSPGG